MRTLRWLPVLFVSLALTTSAASTQESSKARVFAVRLPAALDSLAEKIRTGSFERWHVSRNEAARLVVGSDVAGDVEVEARLLPVEASLKEHLEGLPVEFRERRIVLGGTTYKGARYALALRLPREAKPTWLVAGHDETTVALLVDRVLFSSVSDRVRTAFSEVDYLLWESQYSYRSGTWQKAETGFAIDPEERDDIGDRHVAYAALTEIRRPHVVLRAPRDLAAGASLADALEAAVSEMAPRIPLRLNRPVEVLVEQDYVRMGRHLGVIGEAAVADGRLHLVFHPEDLFAYRYGLARLLLRRAELEMPPRIEDGAALWLSKQWYGRPYGGWLADFAAGEVMPTAKELLEEAPRDHRSEILRPPVTAALFDAVAGATVRTKLATETSPDRLDEILLQLGRKPGDGERASSRAGVRAQPGGKGGFRSGVSLAMANGLEVGYHAPGVEEQLTRLADLGVDSVSLMPFAWQPSPNDPKMSFMNQSPGSETDIGMIHAARRAHAHRVRVLWKPHIWVSHGSWPGEIAMTSEEDWRDWWRTYRRYILRHAVLAEWTKAELFSVGVELGKTVDREVQWRELISAVRRIYSGRLTYSGNWWGDYDRAPFWDALDYIGVDAYFPLADRVDAERRSLEEGARRVAKQLRRASERYGKPVLLTEVGFSARKGAWISPHEEGGEFSEDHQKLAYEVLLSALGRPPWLAGVYFWKVFSHPSMEGGARPDFRFLGRGAEEIVRNYFATTSSGAVLTAQ